MKGASHLGIASHVFEEAGDTSERLVKVVALSEGLGNRLEDLFVLFGMCLVDLLRRSDVFFQVDHRMLPGLQSLGKQARSL